MCAGRLLQRLHPSAAGSCCVIDIRDLRHACATGAYIQYCLKGKLGLGIGEKKRKYAAEKWVIRCAGVARACVYIWITSRQLLKVKILKLLKMGFPGSKSAPKYNPRVLEQNIQSFKSYNQLKIRKF